MFSLNYIPRRPKRNSKIHIESPADIQSTGVIFILGKRVSDILASGVNPTWSKGSSEPGFFPGNEYTKDYYVDSDNFGSRGRIVNLQRENISFNLAVFPNILSPNRNENNYFEVMAVVNDATTDYRPVSINNLEMSFFFRNDDNRFEEIETIDKDNTHAKFGVRPAVVRSKQNLEREVDAGSKFYEIFNSQFDAISLRFTLDSGTCEGVLIPNWKRAQRTQDAYTYAVDLGTTNT